MQRWGRESTRQPVAVTSRPSSLRVGREERRGVRRGRRAPSELGDPVMDRELTRVLSDLERLMENDLPSLVALAKRRGVPAVIP